MGIICNETVTVIYTHSSIALRYELEVVSEHTNTLQCYFKYQNLDDVQSLIKILNEHNSYV